MHFSHKPHACILKILECLLLLSPLVIHIGPCESFVVTIVFHDSFHLMELSRLTFLVWDDNVYNSLSIRIFLMAAVVSLTFAKDASFGWDHKIESLSASALQVPLSGVLSCKNSSRMHCFGVEVVLWWAKQEIWEYWTYYAQQWIRPSCEVNIIGVHVFEAEIML